MAKISLVRSLFMLGGSAGLAGAGAGGCKSWSMATSVFRAPVHAVLLATSLICLATYDGYPKLLYLLTQEDGVVEWGTVVALLVLAAIVFRRLSYPPAGLPKFLRIAGLALGPLCLIAAGEEISWGQRIFGFSTPEALSNANYQHETNLHNLIPGELFNGLIIFAMGIAFVLIPTLWRARSASPPLWLPSPELSLFTLDAILINHYRFRSLPEKVGIVVVLALLAWWTIRYMRERNRPMFAGCAMGWVTAGSLYYSRSVLRAANHQYEIREILIVLLVAMWVSQTLDVYEAKGAS